jgi:hypothetical protein
LVKLLLQLPEPIAGLAPVGLEMFVWLLLVVVDALAVV